MRLSAAQRLATGLAVAIAEYSVIGVCFDGTRLAGQGGFLSLLSRAGELFTALIVLTTAGCLVHFQQLKRALSDAAGAASNLSVPFGAAHFGLFGLSLAFGFTLFGRTHSGGVEVLLLVAGGLAGAGALAALLRALFGPAATALGKVLLRAVIAGALLGVLAWQAGMQARPLWPALARVSLSSAAWLLHGLSGREVLVDYASKTLGAGDFVVEIAPGCSGMEGMGLVAVFMGGYIYRFRSKLYLGRALALIPIGVTLAWLANCVRLATLVAIGAWGSPAIAFGGFHSKAGWVLFCSITLSLVWILNHSAWFRRDLEPSPSESSENPTAGYCLPFLALLAVSLLTGLFTAKSFDSLYPLRLVAALAALYWARPYLRDIRLSVSALALGAGAALFLVWLLFSPADAAATSELNRELGTLSPLLRGGWMLARVVGTVLVVPLVEELAFRGFLQRRLYTREFEQLPYRQIPAWAVLVSALAFGALHASWALGTLAGVCYSLATLYRGKLADAIVAHATTNALLAVWALAFGRLDLLG